MKKTFYDIHCHAMNLSHPNLLAFVKRLNLDSLLFMNSLFAPIVALITKININKVMNLLSVMENDLGEFFALMENEILQLANQPSRNIIIGRNEYDSIVLTPLMMDFGQKGSESFPDIHFNVAPHKPISEQAIDLFNGIAQFVKKNKSKKIEIYPFLGINTKNYDLESIAGHTGLSELLDKYFKDFSCKEKSKRREKLRKKMGTFDGNIEHLASYSFAGIKVYPPLGFDPWPDKEEEKEKVRYLYQFCVDRCIPITSHCGGTGFCTVKDKEYKEYTSPKKWRMVLAQKEFSGLKLNLAHFGGELKTVLINDWMKDIIDLISIFDGVYTDISCLCFKDSHYQDLEKILKKLIGNNIAKAERVMKKILFGSDFMINLLWTDSYQSYIKNFIDTKFLKDFKDLMCSENPERFLWG